MPDNVFEDETELEEQQPEETQETQAAAPVEQTISDDSLPSDDDVFAFLDNEAGPDEEAPVEAAPVTQAAPPSPAPPVPAPTAFDRVAEQMAEFLAKQNTPPPAAQPAAAPVWVDPFERPENKEKLEQLQQDGMFNADAAREFNALQLSLMEERLTHKFEVQNAEAQNRILSVNQLNTVNDAAYNSLAQGAAYVDRASFDAATEEFIQGVFGGDRTAFAASANNPVIRQQIANNAELKAIKSKAANRAAPTARPTTTARPASAVTTAVPRETQRVQGAAGRTYSAVEQRLATDSAYEEDVSSRAFGIGPKKRNN